MTTTAFPDKKTRNSYYTSNQAPLNPTPFIRLPVGSIKPQGWLREYLIRQKDGLTGHLGEISAWLDKKDNAWLSKEGKGKWGWEEVPYWLKGYANIGYILGDKDILRESEVWIKGVLASQRPDGNFGPTFENDKGVEDFWPKMIMLYCLESFYEYSPNPKVLDFMTKFCRYQMSYPDSKFMKQYWQSRRTADNLHSVIWLYNHTKEPFLLELAAKIERSGVDWTPANVSQADSFKAMPDWHNVNIAQGFRLHAEFSQVTGKESDVQRSVSAFKKVRELFGNMPGGMFASDENARPGYHDPRQAVETCGMVEQMNSDEEMLRITGDPAWADHAENVAFNTYPAAVMPDFRSLRYLTAANMVTSDSKNHSPGIANAGPFMMMNPFSSRCCQHNHAQGWPYFAENLWQATPDNGVAAVIIAASDVKVTVGNGETAKISLTSNYPFDDNLLFKVRLDRPSKFPFYIRIPSWCDQPKIKINGSPVKLENATGKYVRIERTWGLKDQVEVKLPMAIKIQTWEQNGDSVSVNYGPLTFSLKIGEKYTEVEGNKAVQDDSKWQSSADPSQWKSYEISPTTPWNYGLVLTNENLAKQFKVSRRAWPKDNFPFTLESVPVSITAVGRRIKGWSLDAYGLCGTVPASPVDSIEPLERIQLVPMGAARLRISAFPVVRK